VSIKGNIRTGVLCLTLAFGSLAGVVMCPEEIEELMYLMNLPKIEHVLPAETDKIDD
jgi:hypothetical protein